MKKIIVKISDGKARLTGSGTYGIKDKLKKYGFIWKDGAWEGSQEKLETVASYIKNFKYDEIQLEVI